MWNYLFLFVIQLLQALTDLPVLLENSKPQDLSGVTKGSSIIKNFLTNFHFRNYFTLYLQAPKLNPRRGVIKWDSQSCLKIDRLYRALNDTVRPH